MGYSKPKLARSIIRVFISLMVGVLFTFWMFFSITFGTIPAIITGVILGILFWKTLSYFNQEEVIIKIGNYNLDISPVPDRSPTHDRIFPPRSPNRIYQHRTRHISNEVRAQVRIKYNHRCAVCHRTERETGTLHHVDHILPHSKGGTNDINNLQLLCQDCNLKKRDQW